MKPIKTFERVTFVNERVWIVYYEVFKTVKHVYVKPKGYEFFIFDFILKGKEYNDDVIYHTCKKIKEYDLHR